jgi:hypothetical protein
LISLCEAIERGGAILALSPRIKPGMAAAFVEFHRSAAVFTVAATIERRSIE